MVNLLCVFVTETICVYLLQCTIKFQINVWVVSFSSLFERDNFKNSEQNNSTNQANENNESVMSASP